MQKNTKKAVFSEQLPPPLAPYSHAVIANGFVFVSGQLGLDSAKILAEGIEAQSELALSNVARILAEAGTSMQNVVKVTVLLSDINDFEVVNDIYSRHFPDPKPARAAYAVAALPMGAKVEIEAIAIV